MKLRDLLFEELLAEVKGENLLLLDVDDTLVITQNIYIYRKLPSDIKEVKLTPKQYAKEKITADSKKYYDYRDFRNPDTVANSIKTGIPIVSNLKIMDEYIKKGWKIGVLTARGMEQVVFEALRVWLKYKNLKGELKDIGDKMVRELVHAINDDERHYAGGTDFEKKANVIKDLSKKYDKIIFIDDDQKNLDIVKELGLKNVQVKKAEK